MHPKPTMHDLRFEGGRHEVDVIIELDQRRMIAIEFKAGSAPDRADARHLFWLREQLGDALLAAAVLHSGPSIYELGDRIYAIPLCALWA